MKTEIRTNKEMTVFGMKLPENCLIKVDDENCVIASKEEANTIFINPLDLKRQNAICKAEMPIITSKYGKTAREFIDEIERLNN